jgi:peptide/nickel transport system substrate-binding protein
MLKRRTLMGTAMAAAIPGAFLPLAQAQTGKNMLSIGMPLEPPGLDPTTGAASAIAEITQYNIFETLTKVNADGSVTPMLAESWSSSPDMKTFVFKLRRGVRFENGQPFNAGTVKFSFDRAGGAKSTNKDKRFFSEIGTVVLDEYTVGVNSTLSNPDLPFMLGQSTACIVEPKSAETNATAPVGTGPYKLAAWQRGASCTLVKSPTYRDPSLAKVEKFVFRFMSDTAAQTAALMANDIDIFPRAGTRSVAQFKGNPRFQVLEVGTRGKVILTINNRKKPLDDVRVRRAILAALDRNTIIQGAADGFGKPIGSHYAMGAPGFIDTTAMNPYDIEKAKRLLAEAGVKTPLELRLTLPPPSYARQGGEMIAAQLAQIGIHVKIQNVEWAQWLSGTFGGAHDFDLTMVAHVEPFDLVKYTEPDYYWGYDSKKFRDTFAAIQNEENKKRRADLLAEAQRQLATDAVNGFLYQAVFPTIARKEVKGLWASMPIIVNDLAAISWS